MTNSYKADITLNERDSIFDMLNLEKQIVKIYSTAITEGVSKGFRSTVKNNLSSSVDDQFSVFAMMTRYGYAKVESAPQEQLKTEKGKFSKIKSQLG